MSEVLDRYVELEDTNNEFGLKTSELNEELKKLENQIISALILQELVKKGSVNEERDITIPNGVHDWPCLDGAEHKASCIYLLDQVQRKNKK